MNKYLKSKGAIGIVEIHRLQYIGTTNHLSIKKLVLCGFHLKKHIEKTFPTSLAPEAKALLIGLQDDVDDETTRAYQKLGITHLFAISGLHIAIFVFHYL